MNNYFYGRILREAIEEAKRVESEPNKFSGGLFDNITPFEVNKNTSNYPFSVNARISDYPLSLNGRTSNYPLSVNEEKNK